MCLMRFLDRWTIAWALEFCVQTRANRIVVSKSFMTAANDSEPIPDDKLSISVESPKSEHGDQNKAEEAAATKQDAAFAGDRLPEDDFGLGDGPPIPIHRHSAI